MPFDTTFEPERDMLNVDIGNGLMINLPTAVWSDGSQTLPIVSNTQISMHPVYVSADLPMRLAAISATWGTISMFYPYFSEQRIDWLAALPEALQEAAAARSGAEVQTALAHLLAHLRDNHARVIHAAAPTTGILPFSVRRIDGEIVVTGGLPEYLKAVPVGSVLLEIDGIDATRIYDKVAAEVSAATEGNRAYLASLRMTMGAAGTFRHLHVRISSERLLDYTVPLVVRELYLHANREARPGVGAEVAPGIYYIDLDALAMESWQKFVPKLLAAKAIILDFRGYVTTTAVDFLSHLVGHEISSPIWQIPQLPVIGNHKYMNGHWTVRPQEPKFDAKIIGLIDGRSMSAVETALQMYYENHLGVLVGENSGGTNGNVTSVRIPGGFEVVFTGMRAMSADGSTVQGRGFKPDIVVHPTLARIRAGEDEILEAGIAAAQRLAHP
jgi:hypothetical protein